MSGSNSNSDSSQQQTQETDDNRIASAQGSVNLVTSRSSVGGNVNVTSTDYGSVSKAFDFAAGIAKGAADESAASSAQVTKATQTAMKSVQEAYKDSSGTLAAAYETAKAGEQKVMVVAALAVVGVVAFKALGKAA